MNLMNLFLQLNSTPTTLVPLPVTVQDQFHALIQLCVSFCHQLKMLCMTFLVYIIFQLICGDNISLSEFSNKTQLPAPYPPCEKGKKKQHAEMMLSETEALYLPLVV